LYEQYGVTVVPYLVLTDRNGKVVTKLAGYPESMREGFYRVLHSILGSVPVPSDGT
jgi:thioredoxin-related protein